MITEATSVGELVRALAIMGGEGRASRVFRNAAYVGFRDDVVLLHRGGLRSPMTVNIGGLGDLRRAIAVGDRFAINERSLTSRNLGVGLSRASIYRSGLDGGETVHPIGETEVVQAATALRLLYSVSTGGLSFLDGEALRNFANAVLLPISSGDHEAVHEARNYRSLIGSGSGFTPSGDDFIVGFAPSFNLVAHSIGTGKIALPAAELGERTVQESATIIDYAQRGYVDEGLERMILAAFHNEPRAFRNQMFDLAGRGHTSGLDMSLGVLLAGASLRDYLEGGHALRASLDALMGSKALNALISLPRIAD